MVSLPKDWTYKVGLNPGDYVLMIEQGNRLVIVPEREGTRELVGEVLVKSDAPVDDILREVISKYLAGYDTIRLVFKSPPRAKTAQLKQLIRRKLAGAEIMDETYDTVVIKILLDLAEIPTMKALGRLHRLTSAMLRDAIKAFAEKDKHLAEDVIQRDDEADRFQFLIVRQLSQALLDYRLMEELNIGGPVEALSLRLLARNLERIADHASSIASLAIKVIESGVANDSFSALIASLGEKAAEVFDKCMEAFFRRSRKIAGETLSNASRLLDEIEKKTCEVLASGGELTPLIVMIIDHIRRVIRYSEDIAEIVVNIESARNATTEI